MAFIKNLRDLPQWFKLENYTTSELSLTAEICLQALIHRKTLLRGLGEANTKISIQDFGYYDNWKQIHELISEGNFSIPLTTNYLSELSKIFYFIIADTLQPHNLIDLFSNDLINNHWCLSVTNAYLEYEAHSKHTAPIKNITINDLGHLFFQIPTQLQCVLQSKYAVMPEEPECPDNMIKHPSYLRLLERFDDCISELSTSDTPFFTADGIKACIAFDNFCDQEFRELEDSKDNPSYKNPFIEVDLECSDNLLISQFQEWLKLQREAGFSIKKQNLNYNQTLAKIKHYHIFAFLDLYIWSLLTNNKIQSKVYIEALYPYGAFDENHINKVLIPFINKLFNPQSTDISNLIISQTH